ncbi:RsmE family RNA methyltransferase [Segetibacter koreensis]|uniref:RsmE family RNA methyltransferase n=1 Tax=Segetibacter koreensis TaxID=398037 RepID=UPI00036F862D|nr:RsmE family RNA methyltransferase [Segetibacter koreensis]
MDLPIFFIDAFPSDNIITLNEDTSKHVVQVLRMKPLETLQLTDGAGNLLTAQIVDDHKKRCTVKIVERQAVQKKKQEVCIAISLLKNSNRFEWFLEKATEIGVTEIIPLLCERTEKQHFRYDRMKQITISAMLQSKQVWLPVLRQPTDVLKVISSSVYKTKLIAHCEEEMKVSLTDFYKESDTQILIGPEGDFSNQEIVFALDRAYQPVTLGETRLRTETAGVVAAALLCG